MASIYSWEHGIEWENLGKEAAGAVGIMIDNTGCVWAQLKGCSKDEFIYTLAKYIEVRITWK